MGSSYFYLEFLIAFVSLLKSTLEFKNPALLALEYDLVPDESYPVQLQQTIAAYNYIQSITHDPSKIVVAGDSAGATLILSLLLYLSSGKSEKNPGASISMKLPIRGGNRPGMAVLVSPWATLVSPLDQNTASDYLDAANLHEYAKQYAGATASIYDPLVSPGNCKDKAWWKDAAPTEGFFISFGSEEVFAPEIKGLIGLLNESGVRTEWQKEDGGIHAWPVASLFLCTTKQKRTRGLKAMVKQIGERMGQWRADGS